MRVSLAIHRLLLAAAVLGFGACGERETDDKPLQQAPTVTLRMVDSNVAGTQLTVFIDVHGCESVDLLQLWHRDVHLQDVPYVGNSTPATVTVADLPGGLGAPAGLRLVAEVTCDGGRRGASLPYPATFLPVAQVTAGERGAPAVHDVFWADGSGPGVTFLGCSAGSAIVRLNRLGQAVGSTSYLTFPCTHATYLTDRNPASGKRWAVTPGVGAFALNDSLEITAEVKRQGLTYFAVGPEGDAVIWTPHGIGDSMQRISHADGTVVWSRDPHSNKLLGHPVVHDGKVLVPSFVEPEGAYYRGYVCTQVFDYSNGVTVGRNLYWEFEYDNGPIPVFPDMTFSPDGQTVYMPVEMAPGSSQVFACMTHSGMSSGGCQPGNRRWVSPLLQGSVTATVPFAAGARLAAASSQFTWFLNTTTGALSNLSPLMPTGSLVAHSLLPGKGRDLYQLNHGGDPLGLPTEVIAIDGTGNTEVFRYPTDARSLFAAVDDAGQLWLRIGDDLVRPLSNAAYAQMK